MRVGVIALQLVGDGFAIAAGYIGMRMKPDDYAQVDEVGRAVFGGEALVKAVRDTGRLVFWGAVAVLLGIVVQVWDLVSCLRA